MPGSGSRSGSRGQKKTSTKGVGMAFDSKTPNSRTPLTSRERKELKKKLQTRQLKKKLLRASDKAITKKGLIGGKRRGKTRKRKQRGGMPLVVHNLFDGIGFLGSSFINTLKGVPIGNVPLPFLGHFA